MIIKHHHPLFNGKHKDACDAFLTIVKFNSFPCNVYHKGAFTHQTNGIVIFGVTNVSDILYLKTSTHGSCNNYFASNFSVKIF